MQLVVQFFKEMSPIRLAITTGLLLLFILIFIFYLFKINQNDYSILYSDLEAQDSGQVAKELDSMGIPYQVTHEGGAIKVPRDRVNDIRINLASKGLPVSGTIVGYEIFDKEDSIGATNFSQNIKLIRALEGELSRTISAFDAIDKARVHLVMPQREVFSKERIKPRASVVIKFRGNKKLGKGEIDAISHLVITAVPDLDMQNLTIVDTKGSALKIGSAEQNMDFAGSKNEEVRIASEQRLKRVIEDLLASSLGREKVKASVSLEMNFDRIVTNSELYDPDGAVVRSTQTIDEKDRTPVSGAESGDVSVANNIPGGGGSGSSGDPRFATSEKSDQTTNYEISKTIKNHISESGIVKKMSIGILIDGTYNKDPETEEVTYVQRSEAELGQIANLVKVAVGFDDDRGDKIEVINMKFAGDFEEEYDETTEWLKEELPSIFQTLVFAIVASLILITVIRPIALKAFEVQQQNSLEDDDLLEADTRTADGAVMSSLPPGATVSGGQVIGPDGTPIEGLTPPAPQAEQQVNPIEKVNGMVDTHAQDIANTLRKWLKETGK